MKNTIKVIAVIMGTLIGAGFASGKEIHLFFNMYGAKGLIGIILSSILTGLIIYEVFNFTHKGKIENYNEFTDKIEIKKHNKIRKINTQIIIKTIINAFLLISYYIMVAGFGTYLNQEYNIPIIMGTIAINILTIVVLLQNTEGLVKVNILLIPIAIIIIIALGIENINIENVNQSSQNTHWIISSILYYSYNSIILIPILVTLKKYITSIKQIKQISIITSILLMLLSIIIYILIANIDINKVEMPLVYIASNTALIYKYIYGIVILISIFTTAISLGYSFLNNISNTKNKYLFCLIIMVITSIPISFVGFANLVYVLYPIFGVLGIIQIMKIYLKKVIKTDIKYV